MGQSPMESPGGNCCKFVEQRLPVRTPLQIIIFLSLICIQSTCTLICFLSLFFFLPKNTNTLQRISWKLAGHCFIFIAFNLTQMLSITQIFKDNFNELGKKCSFKNLFYYRKISVSVSLGALFKKYNSNICKI